MTQQAVSHSSSGARMFATPLARRIAKERGVNLQSVRGSGPHGRITRSDVESAKPGMGGGTSSMRAPSGPGARQLSDLLGMSYETQPVSGMRKTIAARLSESKQTVPHFYLTTDCRIDALMNARKGINDEANGKYKLSVNDFVIKAVAAALTKVPAANMAWADTEVLQYKNADISVAVATPAGLITPIIKEAQNKTLPQISTEMKDLAARARDGKLKPTEYQGGTFSISNLGMYGVKDFAAIINPPQACILAVGAGVEQPVVNDGRIEVGTVMSVTLSVDHRVVDGAVGAEFLQAFKNYIENPILMLV
jgi:pyruvate dehydrogenase E2 component (dihydrolipoamide acetyltransferase)